MSKGVKGITKLKSVEDTFSIFENSDSLFIVIFKNTI